MDLLLSFLLPGTVLQIAGRKIPNRVSSGNGFNLIIECHNSPENARLLGVEDLALAT